VTFSVDIILIYNYAKLFVHPFVGESMDQNCNYFKFNKIFVGGLNLSVLYHVLHDTKPASCSLMSLKSLPISLLAFTQQPDNDNQDSQQYHRYHNSYSNNFSMHWNHHHCLTLSPENWNELK
jgi:hypothetical protein